MPNRRTCTALAVIIATAIAASPIRAAVIVVPDDYPSIQAALDASVSGDEIQIRPGSYSESLVFFVGEVTVVGLGADPSDVQVLPPSGRGLHVGDLSSITVERVMFATGVADSGGGALVRGRALFRGCAFSNNSSRATGTDCSFGGGVFVAAGGSAAFEQCRFDHNFAGNLTALCMEGFGGALFVASTATARVDGSTFIHNAAGGFEGGVGGAAASDGVATFTGCAFDSNFAGYGGAATGLIAVRDTRFFGNQTQWGPSAIQIQGDGPIERCVFHDNQSLAAPVLSASGPARIEQNTFAWNTVYGGFGDVRVIELLHPDAEFRRNIVARNDGFGIGGEPIARFACNDVWENVAGEYEASFGDRTGIDGNISADPQFCDSTLRVLTLHAGSPCASSGPCGLIGARPVLCSPISSVPPGSKLVIEMSAFPNPASDFARVSFRLPAAAHVRLDVIDVTGRHVARLANGMLPAGLHERTWRASDASAPPGVYFARLVVGSLHLERRIIVLDRAPAR